MDPKDEADYDAWYREEHLDVLHKVPGYRRSQRYKLGPPVEDLTLEKAPPYVAIHEVDDVNRFFSGPEHAVACSME